MPNIERLTTLLEYVERLPIEQIDMHSFKCGTTACLMGHAVSVFPDRLAWDEDGIAPEEIDFYEDTCPGAHFFDLTYGQWHSIFDSFIEADEAVSNLREYIERWERDAQH
jgi:hypothetical protein